MDLVPLAAPALGIIFVAVVIIVRERRDEDTIIDLRDEPCVRLSESDQPRRAPAPTLAPLSSGGTRAEGATLGARLQHVAAAEQLREVPAPPPAERPKERVAIRRRRTPLVAGRHAS